MNSENISRSRIIVAVSVLCLILLAAVALPVGAVRWLGDAWGELARPASDVATAPLNGSNVAYFGKVELEWALPGEFSDPLPTPTPNPDPGGAAPDRPG